MPKFKKFNLKRRWINARPGSVLILVIALLVLLALIGTAYLSSTQTERYTSQQNTINTEADLLIQGMVNTLSAKVINGVFGNLSGINQYRPPSADMPAAAGNVHTGYYNYDSTAVDASLPLTGPDPADLWLADRIPVLSNTSGAVTWNACSWPLFRDPSGNSTFDSPFDPSVSTYLALNKGIIRCLPTYKTENGQIYPGMVYFVPSSATSITNAVKFYTATSGTFVQITAPGAYVTPNGIVQIAGTVPVPATLLASPKTYAYLVNLAADADGDGIADAGLVKVPVGQIDGVTYYVATRVVDANSAVNVSTAGSVNNDLSTSLAPVTNYGFFRSNIGLRELLNTTTATTEMNLLNAYRWNGASPGSGVSPSISVMPVDDNGNQRNDFSWFSVGDAMDQQLARRPGNPGRNTAGQLYNWLGLTQSASLAYHFDLWNPSLQSSLIEQMLYNETRSNAVPSLPYSPTQVVGTTAAQTGYWFGDNFNFGGGTMPLRAVLTGSNPVSNAVPSRLASSSSNPPGSAWTASNVYEFGDWVVNTYDKTTNPNGDGRTYVCLLHHTAATSNAPNPAPSAAGTLQYWAVVPWTAQPVKASINTATFEQLWVNFCQVMTDQVVPAAAGQAAQWQPPMLSATDLPNYPEGELPMFRSSIRDNRSVPISNAGNTGIPTDATRARVQLTAMQQMQLRAALAAINTITMRNTPSITTDRQTRSRHIVLPDSSGNPAYDVEVFGTDIQPYIGQMYAEVKDAGGPTSANFIAIQLVNPYPVAITTSQNWGLATIDRTMCLSTPALQLTSVLLPAGTPLPVMTIPPATAAGPGIAVIYDGTVPTNMATSFPPAGVSSTAIKGLIQAIGKELVILKTRRLDGTPSSQSTALDNFDEGKAGAPNLYDLVPVDQIDMTGANTVTYPADLYYRRGANPAVTGTNGANFSWNFVWPGFYTPYNTYNITGTGTAKSQPGNTPSSSPIALYPFNQAIIQGPPPSTSNPNLGQLCGGPADPSGAIPISPTYNTISMQMNNVGFPGPNPVAASSNQFPFGGFARNADMLQIPFTGAYRISGRTTPVSAGFYEMNSVTMDTSLANDSTLQQSSANIGAYSTLYPSKIIPSTETDAVTDLFVEQIGRFCPIGGNASPLAYNFTTPAASNTLLDFGTDNTKYHYHWTKRLFDYFTVQAPHDDYFPNVDPAPADSTASPLIPAKYAAAPVLPVNNSVLNPFPANFANAVVPGLSEDTVGVEGLVNINTAPWPVLAMLPFVPPGTDTIAYDPVGGGTTVAGNGFDDNVDIAKAIVDYRATNGPFRSIADLYNVPAVRLANDQLLAVDPGSAKGDFSPEGIGAGATTTPDGVRFDFEERFLLLNRVSNLITTRSDNFTCYVLLQGWRNVGTNNPTLAVQRRAAFIIDRSGITPANSLPLVYKFPTD